ncbi:MAG TPA: hypothetical protein ENK57_08450 [Polyangiaceae bacterium]|nr:hypothetical protein [Polyangiaceae bacterium]
MGDVPAINKHGAIALVAAAVILLQVTLTRVLSVVLWYHWAFFSISLAMLGMGVPGVLFASRPPRRGLIERSLLASAVLVPVGVAAVVHGSRAFGEHAILFCLLGLLPAALALGTSVCVLLLDARGRAIGRRYAFDLLGACLGALLVVPLMSFVATPLLCAGVGLLALAAYALVAERRRWLGLVVAAMILGALVDGRPFKLSHTKEYEERAHLVPLYERWTPTARIAVFDSFMPPGFRWGAGTNGAPQEPPEQLWLEQDGSAGTPITKFDGDWSKLEYLLWDVTAIGYQIGDLGRVAIVGAGGGRDILAAKLAGAETVHAIELNDAIVDAVNRRFGDFSGHVYSLPGVEARVGEGRSVLTRSEGGYDLIQISMIDSWSATAAGAYALSENNLYTVEAYQLYLRRLAEDGIVATSRWMPGGGFGLEVIRLLILVREALVRQGVSAPLDHIVLVQGGKVGTVLASPTPFDEARLSRIAKVADQRGLRWFAGTSPVLKRLLDSRTLEEKSGVVLTPPTDDRPFFFQAMSPFGDLDSAAAERLGFNAGAVVVLRRLMLVMTIITVVMFFAPFLLARWMKPGPGFWRGSGYFTAIGLSFMFVEIAWLQRFVLYLGHPSLATTVTLGAMLLGAGMGSALSTRLGPRWWARRGWAAPLVVAAFNAAFGPLFAATLGWGFAARVVVAILAIAPAGFVMGFFFPIGMVRFGDRNKAWFWALNGAAGVLASVLSLALSMELGFRNVAWIGAGLYALAWGLGLGREAHRDEEAPPASGDRGTADEPLADELLHDHAPSPVSSFAAE